jgi:hypothetical protein
MSIVLNKKTATKKVTKNAKTLIWSKEHEGLYTRLFNKLYNDGYDVEKETYIQTNKRMLLSYISDVPVEDGSKKALYFMVGRFLEIQKDRYAETYKKAGYDLYVKINQAEHNNEQSERERTNYQSLAYYENILKEDYDDDYEFLLLSMLTYQPPVRSSFYNSAIFIDKKKDNDLIHNFLYFDNAHKKIYYIVNDDKVKNNRQYMNNQNSYIEVESPILKSILRKSYEENPRTYVFENNESGYSYDSLLRKLRKITKISAISINMFRSAWVNEYYHDKKTTLNDKKKLALKMRHSIDAAEAYYYKVFDHEDEPFTGEECEEVKHKYAALQQEKRATQDTKILEKAHNKKRYDVVYNLNKKGIKPLKSSIEKYDLKLVNGKWE